VGHHVYGVCGGAHELNLKSLGIDGLDSYCILGSGACVEIGGPFDDHGLHIRVSGTGCRVERADPAVHHSLRIDGSTVRPLALAKLERERLAVLAGCPAFGDAGNSERSDGVICDKAFEKSRDKPGFGNAGNLGRIERRRFRTIIEYEFGAFGRAAGTAGDEEARRRHDYK